METFKIRSSAISGIMTKPKRKDDLISAGAKTYCKNWYTEKIYERTQDVTSKYMDKGNIMEDNSIDFIAKYLNYDRLIKNDEWFENDYMTGTPDVITDNEIIEVKNSWNCFTFPLLEDNIPTKGYYYQTQGYMHLTGLKKAKLIYTLMDTPEHLIEKEYRLEDKYRIKIFEIDYDEDVVNTIIDRVNSCREYLKTIKI